MDRHGEPTYRHIHNICLDLFRETGHDPTKAVNERQFVMFDNVLRRSYQRRLIVYQLESLNAWEMLYPVARNDQLLDPVNGDIILVLYKSQ
jgi:hypothetical protein